MTARCRPARARRRAAAGALLFLLVLGGSRAVSTQTHRAGETFDAVWKIVRDTHFDPAFDLEQWDRVNKELRPRALEASTPGALRAVLADMLGRLGLSHFSVIPSGPDHAGDTVNLAGQPGFDVRLVDRKLVVTEVEPNGPAAAAGVHTGWIVERIGTTPAASIVAGIADDAPARIAQLEAWRRSTTLLRGGVGTPLEAIFIDGAGKSVATRIERTAERGAPVTVGSLPTMFVRVAASPATTPAGRKAGVIGFNVWMTAVDGDFQKAVDRFRSADGIVLDLRGNPGGLAAMIMGVSGHFLNERLTLGVMKTKQSSELQFNANPRFVSAAGERVEPFSGPLAILIDGLTGSASECFTGGMQSLGRARVFGQTSMGQALPALFDRLPNGDVLIHAWGDFVTGTGVRIEGRGVVPDEPVALTREALLEGRDVPLERALAWIDRAAAESRNSR